MMMLWMCRCLVAAGDVVQVGGDRQTASVTAVAADPSEDGVAFQVADRRVGCGVQRGGDVGA
jgi:hypothetical protein